MKVVFRNFYRNEMVNLTLKSVRRFMPNADVHVVSLFKNEASEYGREPVIEGVSHYYRPTRYHGMGSAVANDANGLFFTEGYNYIADIFKDCDEKVLMLAEDHFFTTGKTLKELQEKEFDVAYAPWDSETDKGANGSILCVRPKRAVFPIPEMRRPIEGLLQRWIDAQSGTKHRLSTRAALDYKGDGFYTNDVAAVGFALKEIGI